jgi:hypothetical protein
MILTTMPAKQQFKTKDAPSGFYTITYGYFSEFGGDFIEEGEPCFFHAGAYGASDELPETLRYAAATALHRVRRRTVRLLGFDGFEVFLRNSMISSTNWKRGHHG